MPFLKKGYCKMVLLPKATFEFYFRGGFSLIIEELTC